jgi:hypothetical protein
MIGAGGDPGAATAHDASGRRMLRSRCSVALPKKSACMQRNGSYGVGFGAFSLQAPVECNGLKPRGFREQLAAVAGAGRGATNMTPAVAAKVAVFAYTCGGQARAAAEEHDGLAPPAIQRDDQKSITGRRTP